MEPFKILKVEDAKKVVVSPEIIIADIRDQGSFDEAHIPQAIHLDDKNIKAFLSETDRKKKILCYCYHGISSQNAANFLKHEGFQEVYSLEGGFEEWRRVFPEDVDQK